MAPKITIMLSALPSSLLELLQVQKRNILFSPFYASYKSIYLLAAIIMIFLLVFYKSNREVVFGVLFAFFLFFLSLCLFFTYYLGYITLPLVDEETITDRVRSELYDYYVKLC